MLRSAHLVNELFRQPAIWQRHNRLCLQKGEAIYHADDPAGGIFCAESGRVDMHLPRLRAGQTLVHATGPGWWLGDMAAVSGQSRRFDLLAGQDSVVLRVSRSQLLQLCETWPEAWQHMSTMLTLNMRMVIDCVEGLYFANTANRLATTLLRLQVSGGFWKGELPFSQGELASISNMSRRRVNAALESLEEIGCVRRGYRVVSICDPDRLQEIAED